MKIKNQLAIFNALTRLLVIVILWFMLPILVQKVIYQNTNKELIEKKQKFIKHLDKDEINDFIVRNDSSETFASFSTLHSEFLQLSRVVDQSVSTKDIFVNETRIIEGEENEYRILRYNFIYENILYELEIGSSLSEVKDLTFIIRFFVLILLVIVVFFTFLMDPFYIEYLLKPFYQIIDKKIRKVNEPDSFDYTPIVSNSTDFQELDSVLNEMMQRISTLFNNEKQFIANVSHELLTPIALLSNKFENLIQNPSLDNNAVDKIASSLKTLGLLKKIINNLLLISRIENHQFELNESINLLEIVNDLFESLEDRIEEKELVVNINLNQNNDFIGNKTLIHVLFYNIIVNAIKYNKRQGSISITDILENQKYTVIIEDTGIGMTVEQSENIFNRFTRVNFEQDGQGLGLAIVYSIAQLHQIEIKVTTSPDSGSQFILSFPE